MRFLVKTLGCRLNQAESKEIMEALCKKGFLFDENNPELIIINSCAVTIKADKESRQAVRQFKRKFPEVQIALMGCSDFKIEEVDIYLQDKERALQELLKYFPEETIRGTAQEVITERTRENIKIQTGCNNACTYCVTRLRRGKPVSREPKKIIQQINQKVEAGAKEVVITGVNIGQHQDLTELLEQILAQTEIRRVRLSSIDPEYVYKHQQFFKLFKNSRMCQHLHLSLQSGSDTVLKRMNRKYLTQEYLEITKKYYQTYPNFGFTTDVIVGFPGETEKEFKQTCEFVKACGFFKIHIFRYSPRPETPAASMPDQVDEKIKHQRAQELEKINQELKKDFQEKMLDKELEVLFEVEKDGDWIGHAGNYLGIKYETRQDLENTIKRVEINRESLL